jgi:hypothetical protein
MVGEGGNLGRVARPQTPITDSGRQPRRAVVLEGFGLLPDGATFAISVCDLSYDGCKVETALALLAGVKLKLSILRLGGALDATVRWYKDGRAGLQFSNNGGSEESRVPRRHERIRLEGEVSIRRTGRRNYQCRMFDLTPMGCRIEFIERARPGEMLWVKFEGLDSLEAAVRWADGFYGGVEFARPIYPAVFELLLARLHS